MAQTLFDLLGDPEAAAFAPAFAKDKRRKPSNIDVLNAGIAGIGDLAYDAAGFPVDLSAGLMRALGFDVGQTPLGSDWLKSKATSAGIRPPESADPTLRDVRLGAEMMSGGIDPFATAKGIGMAGSAIAREAAPIVGRGLENYANKAGLNMNMLPPEAAAKVMGQTKIVDEAGMPKLLYRGSRMEKGAPLDWNEARQSQTGKGQDTGQWFSDNTTVATSYAGSRGQEGYVAPAYLDMRNPLVVDAGGNAWGEIPREGLGELANRISKKTLTTDEIARIAKAQGYDGVEFKNIMDAGPAGLGVDLYRPSTVYVTFNPKAARSALSDKAIAGVARVPPRPKAPAQQAVQKPMVMAPVSESGFYSAVEQAALNLEKTDGTGQGLLNELMKAPDVKKDEMDAIGLIDAFKDKPKATKQELIDYIGQNKIELGQTRLAEAKAPDVEMENYNSYFDEDMRTPNGDPADDVWGLSYNSFPDAEEATSFTAYRVGARRGPERVELYDSRGNFVDEYDSVYDAQEYVQKDADFNAAQMDTNPKYENYTLRNGKNYQETLLTMPNQWEKPRALQEANSLRIKELRDQMHGTSGTNEIRAEISRLQNENQLLQKQINDAPIYTSSHWDQPNVMAHVRTQDFVDADGKNMRVIEEAQSDWHQEGREKGYKTGKEKSPADIERELTVVTRKRSQLLQEAADLPDSEMARFKEMNAEIKRLGDEATRLNDEWTNALNRPEGVPDAPMKETWYQTALRKAVKDAIDAGQDRVGITTGARQIERYDLSKQVDRVIYNPESQSFNVYGKNDDLVYTGRASNPEELEQYVGKDATKKVLQQLKENPNKPARITGLDLQVGGEGMKKYYDETYPKYLEKFAKKYGATVKEGSVPTERSRDANGIPSMYPKQEPVKYIDITPEMRKAFGGKDKGVPLFQAAPLIPVGIGAGGLLDQFGERQQ